MTFYTSLLRPMIFSGFNADPEAVQQRLMALCQRGDEAYQRPWMQGLMKICRSQFCLTDKRLSQSIAGLTFANPVGLAAGFDKNGVGSNIWPNLGFGFSEIGTVTHHGQPGNPRPRLFRLPDDQAAINRMGFNNVGSEAMAETLAGARARRQSLNPLGINLGKSKVTPLDKAADDYATSFQRLKSYGDYFVVNVSSPNTPGLRSLQAVEQLEPILARLCAENEQNQPIFLKIAPDLAWEDISDLIQLVQA
ncbi:MAG: quinone-dependent dihydroorotate dehydrogenase, partial [Cyanobacteria bacterium P01_F01_bin.42]